MDHVAHRNTALFSMGTDMNLDKHCRAISCPLHPPRLHAENRLPDMAGARPILRLRNIANMAMMPQNHSLSAISDDPSFHLSSLLA